MSDWPVATRKDHEQFCLTEEWIQVRNARGKAGSHHHTYEKQLTDGRILRTRISHPIGRTTYNDPKLWAHILRDQLSVTEAEFWACVNDGVLPDRGEVQRRETIPAALVHLLINTIGLPDREVAAMSKEAAIARVNEYWTTGR